MPDIVIMRISENVPTNADAEFVKKYGELINYVKSNNSVIVITDGFWKSENVNHLIKTFAISNNYTFIKLSELSIPQNQAIGLFSNQFVGLHPNNKGMREIADKLWSYIAIYFN